MSKIDGEVIVKTDTDEEFVFDEVVVTTPLGWLKKNHESCFSPPLPPRIISAINSLGYGCLEKVFFSSRLMTAQLLSLTTIRSTSISLKPSGTHPQPTTLLQMSPALFNSFIQITTPQTRLTGTRNSSRSQRYPLLVHIQPFSSTSTARNLATSPNTCHLPPLHTNGISP